MGKKSVHFGGGAIGRGFVAQHLHSAGYEVVFIDVVDALIDQLQKTPTYTVTEVDPSGEKSVTIDNYRALNSKTHESDVINEIATADTVTCAVGPHVLKFLAPAIAKGIAARSTALPPLAVIACENAINATTTLAGFIKDKLDPDTLAALDARARFANSAVDRIVPGQPADAGLNVRIEKFYEWCVEKPPFDGGGVHPEVSAIHYVDDLGPYIERKLFTVNTGHATTAYYGYNAGKKLVHEALADDHIHDTVRAVLKETANLIVKKHGIPEREQTEYVEAIIKRFQNPALQDKVERVARAPLRKLGRKERFIGPAAELAEMGESVDALVGAVEMALRFQDVEGDDESKELAKILKENDAKAATAKLTGLEEKHPLFGRVLEKVQKVQKEGE